MQVTNPRYRKDAEISEFAAGRDLKKLCEVELLVPEGERKMRTYGASKMLLDARTLAPLKKVVDDPYELIQRRDRRRSLSFRGYERGCQLRRPIEKPPWGCPVPTAA
jgi:hypothetical protein